MEGILREKEEEYHQLKRVFLSHVNHEIRTPMNSIIGFTSLLADDQLTPDQRELYLGYIRNSSECLLGIIENMIDMAMLETGQVELYKSAFSLPDLFRDLYARISRIKHTRGRDSVALLLSTPRLEEDLLVSADRYRLEQVMVNLMENAIKFTDRGIIEFGFLVQPGGWLELFVRDTGRGVEMSSQRMIFESFRKGRSMDEPFAAGGGLGLSIVRALVRLMQGEVWVEPNGLQGSVFRIRVPLVPAEGKPGPIQPGIKRSFLEDLQHGSRHIAI